MASKKYLTDVHAFIGDIVSGKIDKSAVKSWRIMGTVVEIVTSPFTDDGNFVTGSNRPIVYEVDDGTGVLRVIHYVPDRRVDAVSALETLKSSEINNEIFALADASVNRLNSHFQIGTCVEAVGILNVYRGLEELKAYNVREVVDVRDEVERMGLMSQLREDKYYERLMSGQK